MNHVQVVAVYAVCIFAAAEAAALLAHCVRNAKTVVSYFNVFGGGVLLAAGLVHLLADGVSMTDEASANSSCNGSSDGNDTSGGGGESDEGFPWPYFACTAAIYGFIVLETTVNKCAAWAEPDDTNRSDIEETFVVGVSDNSSNTNSSSSSVSGTEKLNELGGSGAVDAGADGAPRSRTHSAASAASGHGHSHGIERLVATTSGAKRNKNEARKA
jgi:hypothetical protein